MLLCFGDWYGTLCSLCSFTSSIHHTTCVFCQSRYNLISYGLTINRFHAVHFGKEDCMPENDKVEFIVEIHAQEATTDEIDRMARNLFFELRELDVESVEFVGGESVPDGAKGDPITTGAIAIAVLPVVLPKIVEVIQGWLLRGSNRTVKFKGKVNNQAVDFEGSSEDLQKLLESLLQVKKRK